MESRIYIDVINTSAGVVESVITEHANLPGLKVIVYNHTLLAIELLDRLYRPNDEYVTPMPKDKIIHLCTSRNIDCKVIECRTPFLTEKIKLDNAIFVGHDPRPYMAHYVLTNKHVPNMFLSYDKSGEKQSYINFLVCIDETNNIRDLALTFICWHIVSGNSNYLPKYAAKPMLIKYVSNTVDSIFESIVKSYPKCDYTKREEQYELMDSESIELERTFSYQTMLMYIIRLFVSGTSESRQNLTAALPWWYGYYYAPYTIDMKVDTEKIDSNKMINGFTSYGNVYEMQPDLIPNFLTKNHQCRPLHRARNYLVLSFARIVATQQSPIARIGSGKTNIYHKSDANEFFADAISSIQ